MISIITVTHNNLSGLKKTLSSIKEGPWEIIIIDGNSRDGTVPFLQKQTISSLKWVSEPDNGIYDAMNKGLKMASGQYVIFMNAGDTFTTQDTLYQILEAITADHPDIIYSETQLVDDGYNIQGTRSQLTTKTLPPQLNKNTLRLGMVVCHQSIIVKRNIAPLYITDNLSADYDWLLKAVEKANNCLLLPIPIAHYLMGGTSKRRLFSSLKDRLKIMLDHYGIIGTAYNHILIALTLFKSMLSSDKRLDYI